MSTSNLTLGKYILGERHHYYQLLLPACPASRRRTLVQAVHYAATSCVYNIIPTLKRHHFLCLSIWFLFLCSGSLAQQKKPGTLVHSIPVTLTPLSVWDSDLSLSGGIEYRFHSSFSVKLSTDYIYSGYNGIRGTASGFRFRQELRYYIAGDKLINSRSKVWPYIAAGYGNKWVTFERNEWFTDNTGPWPYERYTGYTGNNHEWYVLGKMGIQTAFGKNKRFLFDIATSLGRSNAKVRYNIPEDAFYRQDLLFKYSQTDLNFSKNRYNGNFYVFNAEACFGYRLGR